MDSPAYSPLVRATFAGIRRQVGTAQIFKRAILTPEIRQIVNCCPETLAGVRDKALCLCSYAMPARRSEAAALRVEDLETAPEGLIVTIWRSKTDQDASGTRMVGIPYGADEATCPIRALRIYMEAADIRNGTVFRGIDQVGRVSAYGLHRDSVGYIIKRAAGRAGMKLRDNHSYGSAFVSPPFSPWLGAQLIAGPNFTDM
jgi:integrase